MKTYSKLALAFLFLILVVPQVDADDPPKNGPYVEYYDNGQKKREAHYKNGRQEGVSTTWYENGQKEYESNHKNGKWDGLATRWYSNGQKWWEGHYKNGKLDGLWTYWYENGKKKEEIHYKNGERDGLMTEWDENGKKTSEAHYKNGKKDGLWTYWYEGGQKKSEWHYKDGKKNGLFVEWDASGHKKSEKYYEFGNRLWLEMEQIKIATDNKSRVSHKRISKSKEFMKRKSEFLGDHGTLDKKEYQQLFNGFCDQGGVPNCGALAAFGVIPTDFREELFRCSFKRVPEGWEVRIPFGRSDGQVILVKPEDLQPQTAQGSNKNRNRTLHKRIQSWKPAGSSLGWQILEAAYILKVYNRDANGKMNLQDYVKPSRSDPSRLRPDDILDLLLPTDGSQRKRILHFTKSRKNDYKKAKRLQGEIKRALDAYDPRVDMYVAGTVHIPPQGVKLVGNHAYSITNVNATKNRILLFNPHDDRKPIVMSYDMFMEAFGALWCVTFDCNEAFR